jgi:hypothetical protein
MVNLENWRDHVKTNTYEGMALLIFVEALLLQQREKDVEICEDLCKFRHQTPDEALQRAKLRILSQPPPPNQK